MEWTSSEMYTWFNDLFIQVGSVKNSMIFVELYPTLP